MSTLVELKCIKYINRVLHVPGRVLSMGIWVTCPYTISPPSWEEAEEEKNTTTIQYRDVEKEKHHKKKHADADKELLLMF